MQRQRLLECPLLSGPAIDGDQAGLARYDSALWHCLKIGNPIGASHGDQFRVGIDGDPRLDVRRVIARFGGVLGRTHAANFRQPQDRIQSDHARIKMLAFEIDSFCAIGRNDFSDRGDFSIADQDLAGRKRFARNGVDGGAGEQNRLGERSGCE